MKTLALLSLALLVSGCHCPSQRTGDAGVSKSTVTVVNQSSSATIVYVAFGADSVVTPWSFCPSTSALNCSFPLGQGASQELPLHGQYLNATITFGAPVGCGTTKAELNVNNPKWYDTLDVSLVDGFSNFIAITAGSTSLGPPKGATGNEKVFGLFPLGCDVCTARQSPPCGMSKGTDGCKAGTQYKPDVPCQYQGPTMGGGSAYTVALSS